MILSSPGMQRRWMRAKNAAVRGMVEEKKPRYLRGEPPYALHTDVTKAALLKALSLGRPAQCLASSDAGVVMGNWSGRGQQAVETFQTLTSLWDGNVHTLDRLSVGFRLRGRTLSVAWMAQTKFADWLLSEHGEQGLSSRFLICSDDHWRAPTITDEQIDSLVATEAANQGTPPVNQQLQTFWGRHHRRPAGFRTRAWSTNRALAETLVNLRN